MVLTDLRESERPLIITGFATLDRLIDFVATADRCRQVQVDFGTEPLDSRRAEFSLKSHDLPREMKEYWLERGISVLLSGKLLVCIERLKTKRVLGRYLSRSRWRLHAKIYVGDQAATIARVHRGRYSQIRGAFLGTGKLRDRFVSRPGA